MTAIRWLRNLGAMRHQIGWGRRQLAMHVTIADRKSRSQNVAGRRVPRAKSPGRENLAADDVQVRASVGRSCKKQDASQKMPSGGDGNVGDDCVE